MTRFLLRRLAHAAFVVFGVSVLAFFFSTFAPGNYLDDMRLNPQISAEQLSALRADYQLDRPMPVRYMLWAVRSGWLPTGGMVSVGSDGFSAARRVRDVAWHMVLPVAVLVASALPVLLRHVRAAVAEALEAPFLRAAEAQGISRWRLLYRYALPATAHPLIVLLGFTVGTLLSGSLLVEVVMSWPGLGPFLLEAILARDLYVVIGGVLLSTLFLVAGNFAADLLLYWADPRIRAEAAGR